MAAAVMNANQLTDHAVQAEKHLEALATGLAHGGADPTAIKTVQKMAEMTRQISVSLAKAQTPPQPKQPSMQDAANGMKQDMQAARQPAPAPGGGQAGGY